MGQEWMVVVATLENLVDTRFDDMYIDCVSQPFYMDVCEIVHDVKATEWLAFLMNLADMFYISRHCRKHVLLQRRRYQIFMIMNSSWLYIASHSFSCTWGTMWKVNYVWYNCIESSPVKCTWTVRVFSLHVSMLQRYETFLADCHRVCVCSCQDESIDELAAFLGVGEQVAALTSQWVRLHARWKKPYLHHPPFLLHVFHQHASLVDRGS